MKNVFLLLIIGLLGCICCKTKVKTGLEGKNMPSFNLLLMDSTTKLNTNKIPRGEPIVLFYFSPLCPYCRAQTEEMIRNINSLSNIRFVMISNFPFRLIKGYYDHYELVKYPNITVGQDFEVYFNNYFQPKGVPYIAIYDSNKKLQQAILGKVRTNLLKDIALK
jgi:thiol-disulfide isomerase/thioredoxin